MTIHDSTIQTRCCPKCKQDLPATPEYFRPLKIGELCLRKTCRQCDAAYARQYHAAHRDKTRARQQRYIAKHRDTVRERNRCRRAERRALAPAKQRRTPEQLREAARERERVYREAHREQNRENSRRWEAEHPEESRAKFRRYYARKRGNGVSHTAADVRLQMKAQTDKRGKLHCWWCSKHITGSYHVDHRIPLAKGGSNAPENLCITCPQCNLSKGAKTPGEFDGRLF